MVKKVPLLALHKEHLRLIRGVCGNQVSIGIPMALQFSITGGGDDYGTGGAEYAGFYRGCRLYGGLQGGAAGDAGICFHGYDDGHLCGQNRGINDPGRIKKGSRIASGCLRFTG